MSDEQLIEALARGLAANLTLYRARDGRRHLPNCRIGQWVDGYAEPQGAPCSVRCSQYHETLVWAARRLDVPLPDFWEKRSRRPRQLLTAPLLP